MFQWQYQVQDQPAVGAPSHRKVLVLAELLVLVVGQLVLQEVELVAGHLVLHLVG